MYIIKQMSMINKDTNNISINLTSKSLLIAVVISEQENLIIAQKI